MTTARRGSKGIVWEGGRALEDALDAARAAARAVFDGHHARCDCALPVALPAAGEHGDAVPFFSHHLLCLHEAPITAFLDHVARDHSAFTPDERERATYVVSLLDSRMRLQGRIPRGPKVISLGETCLPRTLPTKWGLKAPKSLGEKTMPFDLAIHPLATVLDVIRDDFASYLDAGALVLDDSGGYVADPGRGIHWNHEVGAAWREDSFRAFGERYTRRIAHFRAAACGSVLWFACTDRQVRRTTVEALCAALHRTYPRAEARLALLSSDDGRAAAIEAHEDCALPVSCLNLPLPYAGYRWYAWEDFSTSRGLAWERTIADWLETLVTLGEDDGSREG